MATVHTVATEVRRFKQAHKLTYAQLAKLFGISHNYVRKLGCGSVCSVSPHLARQIEANTGGEIKAEHLVFPEKATGPPAELAGVT